MINQLIGKFKLNEDVAAVVISGSQTGIVADELSDYDFYVYYTKPIDIDYRKRIAEEFAYKSEVGNDFFGEGDELILNNKERTCVDIMYRPMDWVKNHIQSVWIDCNASVGYSTAFIHNLKTSKILFDRNGDFQKALSILQIDYPDRLRENIIAKNYPLLRNKLVASYYEQIEKALRRNDKISQAHRISALVASYFDIIFALNKKTHPGEKQLLKWALETCEILPNNFERDVNLVVSNIGSPNVLPALDKMLLELDNLLIKIFG